MLWICFKYENALQIIAADLLTNVCLISVIILSCSLSLQRANIHYCSSWNKLAEEAEEVKLSADFNTKKEIEALKGLCSLFSLENGMPRVAFAQVVVDLCVLLCYACFRLSNLPSGLDKLECLKAVWLAANQVFNLMHFWNVVDPFQELQLDDQCTMVPLWLVFLSFSRSVCWFCCRLQSKPLLPFRTETIDGKETLTCSLLPQCDTTDSAESCMCSSLCACI